MENVLGIRAVSLNGRALASATPGNSSYEIVLTDLPERNILVLDVELPDSEQENPDLCTGWGVIALVVRPVVRPPGVARQEGLE
jgi:hypothetical protein